MAGGSSSPGSLYSKLLSGNKGLCFLWDPVFPYSLARTQSSEERLATQGVSQKSPNGPKRKPCSTNFEPISNSPTSWWDEKKCWRKPQPKPRVKKIDWSTKGQKHILPLLGSPDDAMGVARLAAWCSVRGGSKAPLGRSGPPAKRENAATRMSFQWKVDKKWEVTSKRTWLYIDLIMHQQSFALEDQGWPSVQINLRFPGPSSSVVPSFRFLYRRPEHQETCRPVY